jgi:hypothetical protein
MPCRWVVCPVEIAAEGYRRPFLAGLVDPGTGGGYSWSAAIGSGVGRPDERDDICLCFARGVDLSGLEVDDVVDVLEETFEPGDALALLDQTPRNQGHANRIKGRLSARGVDASDFGRTTAYRAILRRLGKAIHDGFEPEVTRA